MTNDMGFIPFSEIIGQERAINFLRRVIDREKIPHAYLFSGISGIGKRTAATAFAQALNCQNPNHGKGCGKCRSCRQIMGGNFPDLVSLRPEGQFIKIGQVREMIRSLGYKLVSGTYRVSIIHHAEMMNKEAANAFLKTLEEPPPANVLILSVTEPLDLLPTIVSRCQRVQFQPIPVKEVQEWLMKRRGIEKEKALILAKISAGSLGGAIQMVDSNFLEIRRDSLFRLIQLPGLSSEGAIETALEYTKKMKKRVGHLSKGEDADLFDLLGIWKTWYRDLILLKVEGPEDLLINFDFSQKLKNVCRKFKIVNLIESFMVVDRAQRDMLQTRNLDLMMENTMLTLKGLAD